MSDGFPSGRVFGGPDLADTGRCEDGRPVRQLATVEDGPNGPMLVLLQYQYPARVIRRYFELKEVPPPE